jgi:hypothetical protein
MMPPDSIAADEPVRACLALMGELEASLERSRKALLAQDLAGIERGTGEQVGLLEAIDAAVRRSVTPCTTWKQTRGLSASSPGLEEELRHSRDRIMEAVRLQAALLARARSKLRVLANMLADPSVDYGPLLARSVRSRGSLLGSGLEARVGSEAEGSDPCRA